SLSPSSPLSPRSSPSPPPSLPLSPSPPSPPSSLQPDHCAMSTVSAEDPGDSETLIAELRTEPGAGEAGTRAPSPGVLPRAADVASTLQVLPPREHQHW
ncbi:PREDICTED: vegetative cell wall protein gp1-like, partial [Galeopterus variegatus]|uniref:Vegetative cell wall protein gp1-like n=1 Tax=Galeopterus variegatus TaxID=482537 RepID=A0ABM0S354_GALVR